MIILLRKPDPSSTITAPPMPQPSCSLLSLPAELRLQIWELLLIQQQQQCRKEDTLTTDPTRFCSNILLTCKQINTEGTPILYGENTFLAHPSLLSALPSFLLVARPPQKLPPVKHIRVASMIRKFHLLVRLDTDPRFTLLSATESFSHAAVLSLEVFQAMYGSCDFSVLALFEGIRGVGKATVSGSVGDGRYARWLEQSMMSREGEHIPAFDEEYVGGVPSWDAWSKGNR